jgi:hypothetical protein
MSTFYDALKKAEAEHKKVRASTKEEMSNEVFSMSGGVSKPTLVLLIIGIIATAGIGIYRFNLAKSKSATVAKRNTIAATPVVAPAPAPALAPPKLPRAPGTYGLDGIIDAGDNSMAIINGKLLKPEQSIDHLMLKKISAKEVELLNTKDNSTVILKLN